MFSSTTAAFAGEHAEQRAQRLALVGVAHAVDRRQQAVERLGGDPGHGIT